MYERVEVFIKTVVIGTAFYPIGLCDFTMNGEWRRLGSAHSMGTFSAPSPISFTSSK